MVILQDEHSAIVVRGLSARDLYRGSVLGGGRVRYVRGNVVTIEMPDGTVKKMLVPRPEANGT